MLGVLVAAVLVVAMLPVVPAGAAGGVYHVDVATGNDTSGTGAPGAPFKSIGRGLQAASSGDEVVVHEGTYDSMVETLPLTMTMGVNLHGAEGEPPPVIDGGGTKRLMSLAGGAPNTIVEGFEFRDGAAMAGGAMAISGTFISPGWPLITGNLFESNEATGGSGGAIRLSSATNTITATISDNLFIGNHAVGQSGGAVDAYLKCDIDLRDNLFAGNSSENWAGGLSAFSGAIVDSRGDAFYGNTGANGGGAVWVRQARVTIADAVFDSNETTSAGTSGGAISADLSSTVVIDRARIVDNYAVNDGGALYVAAGSDVVLKSSVIANNDCGDDNGGIWGSSGSTMTIVQCSFAGNDGVDTWGNGTSGYAEVYGSIFWESEQTTGVPASSDCWYGSPLVQSIVRDPAVGGPSVIHDDPLFRDIPNGDLVPLLGSPAIDSVTPTCPLTTLTDIDGRDRPLDGDDSGTAWDDMGAFERPVPDPLRLAGASRYDTALEIVTERSEPSSDAVLASGANYPDALSAAGLCGVLGAPLLLTQPSDVPTEVITKLHDLGVGDVWIVGGTGAVSEVVATELTDEGFTVHRIAGTSRYDTAAAVAREMERMMPGVSDRCYLARGDGFADALAVAPLAVAGPSPVLLTVPTSLPATVASFLDDFPVSEVWALGGTSAVSGPVLAEAGTHAGYVDRIAGGSRYDTAAEIAQFAVDDGLCTWDLVGIASGAKFPDALAGGVAAGANGGVMMLTLPTALPTETETKLSDNADFVMECDVYGGTGAVSEAVRLAIKSALGW